MERDYFEGNTNCYQSEVTLKYMIASSSGFYNESLLYEHE